MEKILKKGIFLHCFSLYIVIVNSTLLFICFIQTALIRVLNYNTQNPTGYLKQNKTKQALNDTESTEDVGRRSGNGQKSREEQRLITLFCLWVFHSRWKAQVQSPEGTNLTHVSILCAPCKSLLHWLLWEEDRTLQGSVGNAA